MDPYKIYAIKFDENFKPVDQKEIDFSTRSFNYYIRQGYSLFNEQDLIKLQCVLDSNFSKLEKLSSSNKSNI